MQLTRMKMMKAILCATVLMAGTALDAATAPKVPVPTASKGTYATYVKITWKKQSAATGGYYLKRGTTSTYADAVLLTKCSKTVTSYLDTSAVAGKTYYYWVCPVRGSTLYYNATAYATGYLKESSPTPAYPYSGILGDDKLSYARYNKYELAVNGKIIYSPSLKWSVSDSKKAFMGNWGWLVADKKVSATVQVKATYNRKTYTKNVTIYPSGTYGTVGKQVIHIWRFCSKTGHGWYDSAHSVGGQCPACRSTINW